MAKTKYFHKFFLLAALYATALACNPVYAPPVRVGHYGAPGNLAKPKPIEVQAEATAVSGVIPSASFNYEVNPHLQLEVGGNMAETFAMGFSGIRITQTPIVLGPLASFTFDTELGFGAGVGGQSECGDDACWQEVTYDELDWTKRLAGGGYAGMGMGVNINWFDVFVRGRFQLTKATNIPTTVWLSAAGGVQFTISKRVKLDLAAGLARYMNRAQCDYGGFGEMGVSVYFGAI